MKKGGNMVENRQTQKKLENRQTQKKLENRQSEYFCQTYCSKLNRGQIEKKLWHFEDNEISGREPCRKSRKSDTTFRLVLTCENTGSLNF